MFQALEALFQPPGLAFAGGCPPPEDSGPSIEERLGELFSGLTFKKNQAAAPAPDPRLVEAQISSLGVQDQLIQQIMATTDEMAPLQKQQLEQGLAAAELGQEQALADRQYALERRGQLSGMQDAQLKEAREFNTDARREQLAQQAGESATQAFTNMRGQQERGLASRGIRANSGAALALGQQTGLAEAMTKAGLMNQTRESARMEGRALTDRAANSLAGYPNMGLASSAQGANMGMAGTGLANQGLAGMTAGAGQAGALAGSMGANATNMFNAQASYQVGMEKARQDDGLWGGLGTIFGAAITKSSVAYKENIHQIGHDPRGFGIYEFTYKPEHQEKMGAGKHVGVLAEEVEKIIPEAVSKDADGFTVVDYSKLN